jgi:Na+/glutamate symporter
MRLQVGAGISNNNVRLDFRKSSDKPNNAPSYIIEKNKADEFVKKFNKQEQNLLKLTTITATAFAVAGWLASLKKRSWKVAMTVIPTSFLVGLGVGASISSYKKNKLMDKYNVKEMGR